MSTRNIYIAPSLLSADMARFSEAIELVQEHVDYIHCDVMDGHFVPNLTFGAPVVKALKRASRLPLDVHLMIENPDRWVEDYLNAGLDSRDFLTFHIEAVSDATATIAKISAKGVRPGIAIKPKTYLSIVEPFVGLIDQVLIMTVEPGFGGQSFMEDCLVKAEQLRQHFGDDLVIGVDGGIDVGTAPKAVLAGCNLLVAGSSIYGKPDPLEAISDLRESFLQS
ncbi:ribulose-phosphate 3-epimerase [Calditrichota bacterium]